MWSIVAWTACCEHSEPGGHPVAMISGNRVRCNPMRVVDEKPPAFAGGMLIMDGSV